MVEKPRTAVDGRLPVRGRRLPDDASDKSRSRAGGRRPKAPSREQMATVVSRTTNSTADPEKNTHPHLATSLNRNGAAASDGGAYGWGVARRVSDATDGTFQGTRTVTNRRNIASK